MSRKVLFFVLVSALVCAVCLFSGAAVKPVKFNVVMLDGELVAFNKTYDCSFSASALSRLFYGGDPRNMLNSRFKGNASNFFDYLNSDIKSDVVALAKRLSFSPVEPNVNFLGKGEFVFTDGKNGRNCDENTALQKAAEKETSNLSFDVIPPKKTVDELKKDAQPSGRAKTAYFTSGKARKNNVELAAKRLDGKTVLPGEKLSFNEVVGKRTTENGFSEAKVIVYGEYTGGVGGGVCQVSTTLYNAWLCAGLDAEKSLCHSLEPSYVAPGLDAMVSETSDLVLVNNSSSPAYIGAFYDGNYLEFVVYSRSLPCTVKLASEFVRAIPCDEYKVVYGDEEKIISYPKNGAVYRSYREYIVDGEVALKEPLRTSTYLPQKGKISKIKVSEEE